MHGNARTRGGDRFAMTLDGPNGTRLVASSMVDYNNGSYVGSYLATVAGNYTVHVQRADAAGTFWDIKGSPFKVTVAGGRKQSVALRFRTFTSAHHRRDSPF